MEPGEIITHSGTRKRTPMAEDVQEILRQNSKVLELNGRILDLIAQFQEPEMTTGLSNREFENIHNKL